MKWMQLPLAALFAGVFGHPAVAELRELSQSELRRSVQNGQSVSLSRIMSRVSSAIDGEIVDVRAFQDGQIYYRVLIKQPNGRLGSVILEARSGQFMRANSSIAREIVDAVRSSGSSNRGVGPSGNRGNSGNANRGANSGGGGGNSGGGGGNSGGGGKK